MQLNQFFAKHSVFTIEELDEYLGETSRTNRNAMLAYHRRSGRIVPIRRKLYAVVPLGSSPDTAPIDPYLLASKMTGDAVLAYHTALELHAMAYSVYQRFFYVSGHPPPPVGFRTYEFKGILTPKPLRDKGMESFGVEALERIGLPLRVTDIERTFVDVLDRPDLSGGWEEIWRSLESVEYVKTERVIEYALLLNKSTTAAKLGFFLEQHKDHLMVEDSHLELLREHVPRQPHYLERNKRRGGRLVSRWNLIVPNEVIHRSWAEVP